MTVDYGYRQPCPSCVGAIRTSERQMMIELVAAREARADAREMRTSVQTERIRSRNEDPQHQHVRGRPVVGQCTLDSHRVEAESAEKATREFAVAARLHERNAMTAAQVLATAARRLLEGCDLCGRGPLPANGRIGS